MRNLARKPDNNQIQRNKIYNIAIPNNDNHAAW